jgi:hypothetical protein
MTSGDRRQLPFRRNGNLESMIKAFARWAWLAIALSLSTASAEPIKLKLSLISSEAIADLSGWRQTLRRCG